MKQSIRIFFQALLLLIFSFSATFAQTNHWTRFRGYDGRGVDSNVSAKIPEVWDTIDYKWRTTLPGISNASPVVWGDTIYVCSADEINNIGYLLALNDGSGEILWQKEFDLSELTMHVENNRSSATPAVDQGSVYVVWYFKEKTQLFAISHQGEMKWEAEFGGIEARHGAGSSLTLTDNLVVFTREQEEGYSLLQSTWVAVDKFTGETEWELNRETAKSNSFSNPLLIQQEDQSDQLVFGSESCGLTGVDPETGNVLWERKELFPARVVGSPFYTNGLIVANLKGKALVIDFNLTTGQPADTARYELSRNISPYVPTPIVVGEYLYLFTDNGTVACVQLETGQIIWKERPAGAIYGSPICVNGNLFCITKDGEVLVIKADPNYQLLGVNPLGDGSFSTPVMCGSGMVFRTFSEIMLLENLK